MKIFFLLIISSVLAFAQADYTTLLLLSNPSSVTYLVTQDFEGTGYDNSETWTENGSGTIDEDYTGVVLLGSQSLRVDVAGTATYDISPTFTPFANGVAYFQLRFISLPAASRTIFNMRSSAAECVRLRISATGALRIRAGGGTETVMTDVISTGTTYHIWVEYTKGTGLNAIGSVGMSTSGVRPTSGNSYKESTDGTATTDCDRVWLGSNSNEAIEALYDHVRVLNSDIGDNP